MRETALTHKRVSDYGINDRTIAYKFDQTMRASSLKFYECGKAAV